MNDVVRHLAGLLAFTGSVGTALRFYTTKEDGAYHYDEFAKEDLALLTAALRDFDFLGLFLAAGDRQRVVEYCEGMAIALEQLAGQATFQRNTGVDLATAIMHLDALKTLMLAPQG